jgi:hypothetical protein
MNRGLEAPRLNVSPARKGWERRKIFRALEARHQIFWWVPRHRAFGHSSKTLPPTVALDGECDVLKRGWDSPRYFMSAAPPALVDQKIRIPSPSGLGSRLAFGPPALSLSRLKHSRYPAGGRVHLNLSGHRIGESSTKTIARSFGKLRLSMRGRFGAIGQFGIGIFA